MISIQQILSKAEHTTAILQAEQSTPFPTKLMERFKATLYTFQFFLWLAFAMLGITYLLMNWHIGENHAYAMGGITLLLGMFLYVATFAYRVSFVLALCAAFCFDFGRPKRLTYEKKKHYAFWAFLTLSILLDTILFMKTSVVLRPLWGLP